jgi:hypothetical protein
VVLGTRTVLIIVDNISSSSSSSSNSISSNRSMIGSSSLVSLIETSLIARSYVNLTNVFMGYTFIRFKCFLQCTVYVCPHIKLSCKLFIFRLNCFFLIIFASKQTPV